MTLAGARGCLEENQSRERGGGWGHGGRGQREGSYNPEQTTGQGFYLDFNEKSKV